MKVIFVNRYFHPDYSATSQILSDLAFGLSDEKFDVHVVASRLKYVEKGEALKSYEIVNGVHVHRVFTTGFGRVSLIGRVIDYVSFYIFSALKLLWIVSRGDIVVVKTDPPLLSVFAGLVVRMKRGVLINWLQDIFPEVAQNLKLGGLIMGVVYPVLRILRNRSLCVAAINIVPGQLMVNHLVGQGIPPDKLHVIPNWSDGQEIYPIEREENPLRASWGLLDKFVVGYSGNFGRAHLFDSIMRAAKKLSENKEGKEVAILLIGGGAQLKQIEAEIKHRGLSNIYLQPYQPRNLLAQSLSVPDIHLVSLKPELEGLVVPSKFYGVAAAGRGTLFIGNEDGEIASILKQYKVGLAIKQNHSSDLADSILRLKENQTTRKAMGIRARQVFEQCFDVGIGVRKWEVVLRNIWVGG